MKLTFKTKILLLVIIPLILVSVALTLLTIYQAQKLGEQNVASFSKTIFDLRRGELRNYTELALTSIKHIHDNAADDDLQAQESAKDILRNLAFGEDGYFFVYDFEGINVAHPKKPQLEGKNLWDLQDSNGVYLIRSLVDGAQKTDGDYTEYVWDKPSKGREEGKIGFSMGLANWEWMIGTGLYIDDLEDAVKGIEAEVNDNITGTLQLVAGFAVIFTMIVGFIGVRYTISEGKLADDKLKQLSRKVVQGQEEERARVSRNLQKDISHELVDVLAQLKHVANAGVLKEPKADPHFITAVKTLNKAISDVYRISGELRPEALDKHGLFVATEQLAEEITQNNQVEVSFKKMVVSDKRMRSEVEVSLYRIIQSALNNVVEHSQAGNVTIRIRQTEDLVSLNIQDDGVGFNTAIDGSRGIGIADMRIRAEALGGTFHIFSTSNQFTVIKVDIPLRLA